MFWGFGDLSYCAVWNHTKLEMQKSVENKRVVEKKRKSHILSGTEITTGSSFIHGRILWFMIDERVNRK